MNCACEAIERGDGMGQLGDLPLLCGQVHGMVKAGHKESSDAVAATYTPSPLNIYAKRHART